MQSKENLQGKQFWQVNSFLGCLQYKTFQFSFLQIQTMQVWSASWELLQTFKSRAKKTELYA